MYLNPEQILPTGVASSNLKLWLPLQEGSGTTNYDGSGNQNHGTITGATWVKAETDIAQVGLVRQNSPMIFDGSDDVVTITDINVSYPQLSISVWFYGNTAGGGDHLFGITGTDTLNVYMTHGGGDVYLFRYGNGTSSISLTSPFTEGEWNHAVFIADSTNNIVKVYRNGTEVQSSAQTFDTPVYGAGFHIGARGSVGSPVNTFKDNINEVAIWDEALTASEVTALYNSGTPLVPTADSGDYASSDGLQGYWRNDNDTTWTDRANTGVASFDGTGDYLDTGEPFQSTLSDSHTISSWIKMNDGNPSGNQNIFGTQKYDTYHGYVWLRISTLGGISYMHGTYLAKSFALTATTNSFSDGATDWAHIVVTFTRASATTGTITIYKDGVSVGTTSSPGADWNTDNYTNAYNAYIGASNITGVATNGLNGQIAGTHIFDVALSASEVSELYAIDKRASISGHSKFSDCVGSWLMGAGSGDTTSTIQDQTSENNDATVTNATLVGYNNGTASGSPDSIVLTEGLTSGRDSQGFYLTDTTENCLTLNGAEYVDIPDSEVLDIETGVFTFEFWIKTIDIAESAVLMKGALGGGGKRYVAWINASAGKIRFGIDDDSTNVSFDSATSINTGAWFHIAMVSLRTSHIIYINGASDATSSTDCTGSISNTTSLRIGMTPAGVGTFKGTIDEFRLYKGKALSSDEVTKNYNAGKSKHS